MTDPDLPDSSVLATSSIYGHRMRPLDLDHTTEMHQRQRWGALIERARDLIPLVDRAGDRIERERRVPEDILDALYDARLFRLTIPQSCDGEEVDPATLFQVVEALAQGDASVAWCV